MEAFADFLLPGLIFFALSLRWMLTLCRSLEERPKESRGDDDDTSSIVDQQRIHVCFQTAYGLPWEGLVKLLLSGSGIVMTVVVADPSDVASLTHITHATVYLFLALSGLVDIVHYYGGSSLVPSTLPSAVLTIHFLVEMWLFINKQTRSKLERRLQTGVVLAVASCVLTALWKMVTRQRDAVTPRMALVVTCMLQGTWLCHCALITHVDGASEYSVSNTTLEWLSLLFVWHVAADLIVVVVVTLVFRQRRLREKENGDDNECVACLPVIFDATRSPNKEGHKDDNNQQASLRHKNKESPVSPVSTVAFSTFIANVQHEHLQQQQQLEEVKEAELKTSTSTTSSSASSSSCCNNASKLLLSKTSPVVVEAEPRDSVVLGQYEYRSLAREEALRASIKLKESSLI